MIIQNIRCEGLLSFGYPGVDLPLSNLNVLIGPNGSGKSNLIELGRSVLGRERAERLREEQPDRAPFRAPGEHAQPSGPDEGDGRRSRMVL